MAEPVAQLTVGIVDGRIRCTAIQIKAEAGTFLTGEDLRRIPIARLIAEAVDKSPSPAPAAPDGFPTAGPTADAIRYIANVYTLAYAAGQPPTKAVAALGLTYSTAARWVALARAAGYLSRTERGRASGMPPI